MSDAKADAKEIFLGALECASAEELADYLDQACAGDAALRKRVEELLSARREAGSFLGGAWSSPTEDLPQLSESLGTLIGPYKLLEQIGEGGMGVVYMADQQSPVRRRVALKVIKTGMDTRQVIARFEAERQALALMDHSNIARVLDAGATDTGRPYFVMELVRGIPITEYCDQNNLPVQERLEMFVQVCHAVQHAHQKGIIHRDLKPSNVLVTLNDGRAVPKVIDFGVAKATGQQLTEKTLFTAFAQMVGTPLYMSPEQAEMTSLDIDTRSDIYSLGVLLYELLTGTTPFDQERLRAAAFDEIRRIIREEEPPKPSTRISTLGESRTATAAHRHVDARRLTQLVAGDLDWIAMKCLEKDRTRRYETATGLAQDIERYLTNQPVEACQPTRTYRLRKFIRRNKVGVLAGSAVALALAVGLILAAIGFIQAGQQAVRADRAANVARTEEQIARTQAIRSEQVAQFLKDMLEGAGPSVSRGRDATLLREILDKTAERVDKNLKDEPEVGGDLWFTLGSTFSDIGDYPRAITMFQRSADNYRMALGNENTKLALALGRLGACQSFTGNVSAGTDTAQLGLQMARESGDRETLAACLYWRASSCSANGQIGDEATPYVREALELRKQLGNNPAAQADCMHSLANCLSDTDEAESLIREALALHRQHLEPDHPKIAGDLMSLGEILLNRGKVDEAETTLRQAFGMYRKIHDQNHPYQRVVTRFLAEALVIQGKGGDAEAVIRQEMEASPSNPTYLNYLGALCALRGDWKAAAGQFSHILELQPEEWDDDALDLAVALVETQRYEEYRRLCHEFLHRPANTHDFFCADRAAQASLLLPVDGVDFERACKLADFATTATEKTRLPSAYLVKALAELRRGHFESANDWADRTISSDGAEEQYKAAAWFIEASACARMQRLEAARTALAKGVELLNPPGINVRYDLLWTWAQWTIADLLRREAAELIETPSPAARP